MSSAEGGPESAEQVCPADSAVIVNSGNAKRNVGVLNYTITNGSGTYFVTHVATTVGQENLPTASPKGSCNVIGWWLALS